MLVSIAVAGCTPKAAAVQLEAGGVAGATLWVCEGYGKGWPLEATTMIRLTMGGSYAAHSLAEKLAIHFEQEAVYVEFHDQGFLVYSDGSVVTV